MKFLISVTFNVKAMILHYLEDLSIVDTAKELGTTESAVTWHLFDARKKVKKEIENMSILETDYVYRPGRLSIGISGDSGPSPDTKWINGSLIRQNLCLLCYWEAKTVDELISLTGIPRPYLEYDLDWLVNREFIALEGKKYTTLFPIISRRHMQDIGTMYSETRKELIDKVIDYIWSHEKRIREIGFYGCGFPTERLMWAIITMYISFVSRNSPLLTKLKRIDGRPIRPDGGKYIIMAGDKTEGQELDPNGYQGDILWGGYCGIMSDSCIPGNTTDMYYWLGVNCFAGYAYHPDIAHADATQRALLHWIYTSVIEPWVSEDKLEPHG
ncbi:MAG: sigma factor-like helix-turn-helix DNA-binding protein [Parabacteroides sp.]|nr:sigma factor-like helix-turn-helix DNA-binding protein [Parabacteroides sp.]